MSKRNKNDCTVSIEIIHSPYKQNDNDSFEDIYNRYLEEKPDAVKMDGLVYYKALQITKMKIESKKSCQEFLIVNLPRGININSSCKFVDENENEYEYLSIAMYDFRGGIPEWYTNTLSAILSIPEGDIGEYFAKKL